MDRHTNKHDDKSHKKKKKKDNDDGEERDHDGNSVESEQRSGLNVGFVVTSVVTIVLNVAVLVQVHKGPRGGGGDDDDLSLTTEKASNQRDAAWFGFWKALSSSSSSSSKTDLLSPDSFSFLDVALFVILIVTSIHITSSLSHVLGRWILQSPRIPVRGKHLDVLEVQDWMYIWLNYTVTGPFVYYLLRYLYYADTAVWDWTKMTVANTVAPLLVLFGIYDFFYTLLHWCLHLKALYGWIHKHHHWQKAPSRGTNDAVNVHPLEFHLGEYNHLWAIYLWCSVGGQSLHVVGALLFLFFGGLLAALNHTRYNVVLGWTTTTTTTTTDKSQNNDKIAATTTTTQPKWFPLVLFDSKVHDVHHRFPQCNYGQYTMFWDYVFGTFRPYNPNDRVNPLAQLDPQTGQSLEYTRGQRKGE